MVFYCLKEEGEKRSTFQKEGGEGTKTQEWEKKEAPPKRRMGETALPKSSTEQKGRERKQLHPQKKKGGTERLTQETTEPRNDCTIDSRTLIGISGATYAKQRRDGHSREHIRAQVIVTLSLVINCTTQGRRVEDLTWSTNRANIEEVQCINKFVNIPTRTDPEGPEDARGSTASKSFSAIPVGQHREAQRIFSTISHDRDCLMVESAGTRWRLTARRTRQTDD